MYSGVKPQRRISRLTVRSKPVKASSARKSPINPQAISARTMAHAPVAWPHQPDRGCQNRFVCRELTHANAGVSGPPLKHLQPQSTAKFAQRRTNGRRASTHLLQGQVLAGGRVYAEGVNADQHDVFAGKPGSQ